MSFRKITKNIYERSWERKDGTIAKTFYYWLMIDGKVVHQRAIDPDNPTTTLRQSVTRRASAEP